MLRPTARSLAVLAALTLTLVAACGTATAPGGSASPSGSRTPGPDASTAPRTATVTSLAEARAAWAQSPASTGQYQLRVVRSCFCAPVGVDVTVRGGAVAEENVFDPVASGASPSVDPSMPRTVEDLFALIAGNADGYRTVVTYSSAGVPLSIALDPVENAVDDESSYRVVFSTMEGEPVAAAPDGSWRAEGAPNSPAVDAMPGLYDSALAYVDRSGATPKLRLALWGSSSCPDRPVTLRPGTVRDGVVVVTVDVDATGPADQACTADLAPTWYAAGLPDSLDGVLLPAGQDAPVVRVVLESVVGSTGNSGSSARTTDLLR